MNDRKRRILPLLAVATAVLVNAVSPAVAGVDPAGTPPAEPSNPLLRNDVAHNGAQSAPSPAPVVVRVDGGFDWVSAGVGAAGGFGLVLVAGTAASALRRRDRLAASA